MQHRPRTLPSMMILALLVPAAFGAGDTELRFDAPAKNFTQSLPLGNGRLGAMVSGGVEDERIVLNETSMWSGSPQDADRPDAYRALPEIRALLREGKNVEAEALVNRHFTCEGPGSGRGRGADVPFGCYQVLGNLHVRFGETSKPLHCASGHRAYVPNQEIEYASDGRTETKWCIIHGGKPVQWQYDAGKPARPTRYTLTSAEDVPARDPRTWTLEGSSDGETWTLLDGHTDEPVFEKRHQARTYTVARPAPCRYFRFTFTPNPGVTHFQVAEIAVEGVTAPVPEPAAGYRRTLDLATATARVDYERDGVRFQRAHFVSAPDQVFVSHFTADKPGALSFTVALDRPQRFTTTVEGPRDLVMTGTLNNGRGGPGVTYTARVRVLTRGGTVGAADGQLRVEAADEATLLVTAATDYRGLAHRAIADPAATSRAELDRAAARSFDELRRAHVTEYRAWFDRVSIRLEDGRPESAAATGRTTPERLTALREGGTDPALAALYFNMGRYLLISSSRPGGLPANLQGLWAEETQTPWNGDWHLDINVQMNYWPAEVCNLSELHNPLFALVASLAGPGEKTAKAYYGARGWVAHVVTNPWGFTSPGENASWGATTGGSAWLCQHLWTHYDYTRDRDFLARVYPVLKGSALFYLDMLMEEPDHGWLVTGPSNSPENAFRLPDGRTAHVCMGPTVDLQQLRELFGNTARAAELLGADPGLRDELLAARARLAPNQVGPDGRLQEWLKPYDEVDPHHRHVSHMYGLHPGGEITPEGTPELAAAARKSLERRGFKGDVGWSNAWKINLWARLQDPAEAGNYVQRLIAYNAFPNLFNACWPGRTFQIDGNWGGTAGIAEMLLQSHPDTGEPGAPPVIRLLPALSPAWPSGAVRGLRARGGVTVHQAWEDGRLTRAELTPDRDGELLIRYSGTTLKRQGRAGTPLALAPEHFAR